MLVKYVKDIGDESTLNIGQIYVVLSISIGSDGHTYYVIKRSLKHYCFGFFLADCFEIVSPKLPDCWIFIRNKNEIDILPENFDCINSIIKLINSKKKNKLIVDICSKNY